jgi:putative transposase
LVKQTLFLKKTMPIARLSYHTHIKSLVRQGLLPNELLAHIPRTNLYRWRNETSDKYSSFNIPFADNPQPVNNSSENKKAKRKFSAYVRLGTLLASIAQSLPSFHKSVKEHRAQLIQLIQLVKSAVGLKRALRFFNISVSTFKQWSLQSMTSCFQSAIGFCNRIYPNQLSRKEVLKIKEMLLDPLFQYWPIASISYYALRNNILSFSLNTWYKYANKLGIVRARPHSRRKKNNESVRATAPNQIWHADITVFITADKIKHYIYLVVDNFSRKILSWKVTDSVSAATRQETLLDALKKENVIDPAVLLITDGGPENNLKAFLEELQLPMEHRRALVDVHYSNSMIEASNKTLKYNYLYTKEIGNGEQLKEWMEWSVDDFHNRPHISHKGLTPNERQKNILLDRAQLTQNIKQATSERKMQNKIQRCGHC